MLAALGLSMIVAGPFAVEGHGQVVPVSRTSGIERTGLFLMAGDYRRALEACEQAIQERPSAEAYLQLTYVYQAIDAYLEQLSKDESWTAVEQLYLNLAYRHTEDLVDPPGGLARMAKEMIQTSVRQQSDVSAAMAVRLNRATADRLWQEQAQWRHTHPTEWWRAFPDSWGR
jgi:tetratricopeptide (TPR) repeat protein